MTIKVPIVDAMVTLYENTKQWNYTHRVVYLVFMLAGGAEIRVSDTAKYLQVTPQTVYNIIHSLEECMPIINDVNLSGEKVWKLVNYYQG